MSDFEFDGSDLSSTKSIVDKVGSHFYPNGEVVIKNTTMSKQPMKDRTLRSADPAKLLQGDGLFRNPAFVTAAYAQSTQSALHSIIASRAEIDDDVKIPDPDDPTNSKYLTGAAARAEIMKQSVITTGLAPSGFEATIKALNDTVINSTTLDTGSGGMVGSSDGTTYPHSLSGYAAEPNAESFNGGSRQIALLENLTESEKQIYATKIAELNKKTNFGGNIYMFQIDFDKNKAHQQLSGLSFGLYQEGTYFDNGRGAPIPLAKEYLGTGTKNCHVSAALLELLLQLTNSIYIKGGQGTDRGIIGPNFSGLTAENNSISDHSFGRGYDIHSVGTDASTSTDLVTNLDSYRKGLDLLLSTLQKLPRELHPDLIVVHDQLATELGVLEKGLEDANSAVREKYKGLSPYVNFACDSSHRNHIHISFSAKRAGSFLTQSELRPLSSNNDFYGSVDRISDTNFDKLKINYFSKPDAALSPDEIYKMLITINLYSPEVAAIFVGIAERESKFRPGQLNESRKSKDFSFGLFQINLLPAAHGSKTFFLKYPNDENVLGFKLAYSLQEGLSTSELASAVETRKATRSTVDQRIFIPYNQAYALAVCADDKRAYQKIKNNQQFDSYIFGPWGDYKGTYGFINRVYFSVISEVYTANGNKIDYLKKWIRDKFKGDKPFPYIEDWMNGEYYDENV